VTKEPIVVATAEEQKVKFCKDMKHRNSFNNDKYYNNVDYICRNCGLNVKD